MEFKGTKGNWKVDKRASLRIVSEDDVTVACASSGQSGDNLEEEKANAKLISAAPELLDALQYCLDSLGSEFALPEDCIIDANNAIKKALW